METAFSEEQIQARVRALAEQISRDYDGEVVHVVGILESGFLFMADLVRRMTVPVECHFLKMESKDTDESGKQRRSIVYGSPGPVEGRHILLVNALVDSGVTLDHLVQQLEMKNPKSVKAATLVDREDRRRVALRLDYVGFPWEGDRLVGYGLDQDGLYRNLPYLAALPADIAS